MLVISCDLSNVEVYLRSLENGGLCCNVTGNIVRILAEKVSVPFDLF